MTKLCARGKAAAKRKFKVYPSAYANAYASKICAGKIKDPSGVKRKDFKGPKPAKEGTMIKANEGKQIKDDYSFLDDLKDPNRRREAMAGYRGRRIRKQEQKRGPVTYKKGKDTEEILSYPNPFTDVLQMENVYGKDKGKKRLKFGKTDAEKASESRFKKADGGLSNKVPGHKFGVLSMVKKGMDDGMPFGILPLAFRALAKKDKKKMQKKMESEYQRGLKEGLAGSTIAEEKIKAGDTAQMNVGGHAVMGSPINVDADGETLNNASASAYYKDLLK